MVNLIKLAIMLKVDVEAVKVSYQNMTPENQIKFEAAAKATVETMEIAGNLILAIAQFGLNVSKPVPKYPAGTHQKGMKASINEGTNEMINGKNVIVTKYTPYSPDVRLRHARKTNFE